MQASDALNDCEECRHLAAATADVDRQSLLLFLADAWRIIAATGDASAARPAYLDPAPVRARCFH
jgi:hypothetical protein